jgi:D-alanyl-D-alanine endopeptidase (penicillin-binding protein 7)
MKSLITATVVLGLILGSAPAEAGGFRSARVDHAEESTRADVTAKSWLVADNNGHVISSANADQVRPIASITKLLTVMVVLDAAQDLDQMIPMSHHLQDALPKDKYLSRREVLYLAMVKSDNRAAQTLCEQYTGGFDACIGAMNAKMASLGMENSRVYEPSGLDRRNVSTAQDLSRLVLAARDYPEIVRASQTAAVHIRSQVTYRVVHKKQRRWVTAKRLLAFYNTNPMVRTGDQSVLISKTGWTNPAGGCIALMRNDRVVIVLGSRNTHTRIPEARYLSNLGSQEI